jgi:hypothetical protein
MQQLSELQGDNAGPGSHFGLIASHLLTAARSQSGRFFSLQAHRNVRDGFLRFGADEWDVLRTRFRDPPATAAE